MLWLLLSMCVLVGGGVGVMSVSQSGGAVLVVHRARCLGGGGGCVDVEGLGVRERVGGRWGRGRGGRVGG